jgi:hypothetical protein
MYYYQTYLDQITYQKKLDSILEYGYITLAIPSSNNI